MVDRGAGDVVDFCGLQIGRDLQEERRPRAPRVGHRLEQFGQRSLVLKRAQARRVGRGDVDGEIVGEAEHRPHPGGIIADPVGTVLVGADIDADDPRPPVALLQPCRGSGEAAIVESHPVDHGLVLGEPEQTRLRIAFLG